MERVYCGMDLSGKDAQLAWVKEGGEVYREQRILLTQARLAAVFGAGGRGIVAGCEAMDNAFWVHDELSRLGVDMRIAPPYRLKVIFQTCYKTDRIDARKMAELLAKDMFPSIWIPPVQLRDLRELVRLRVRLARERSRWICRHHAVLRRWGRKSARRGRGVLKEKPPTEGLGPGARGADETVLTMVAFLDTQVQEVDRELRARLREVPEIHELVKLLMTVPGVGIYTGSTLALEVGRIDRFVRPKQFFRYCRLTPGVRQSGRVHRGLRLAKDARRDLGWLLVEAAWMAIRTDPYFRAQYRRRVEARMKPSRAIVPVARSLANAIYLVWRKQTAYSELFKREEH